MHHFMLTCQWYTIMGVGIVFNCILYFGVGTLSWLLSHHILPLLGCGQVLDKRPLAPQQLRRELRESAVTIILFGTGLIFPWGLLQLGWAKLAEHASGWQIMLEILFMVVWNEIHFYLNHRLLHMSWLKRFHLPHHRSVVTTPWTCYSFTPVEAVMLGSVLLPPMLLHDFNIYALLFVPIFSIVINNIGHANYGYLSATDPDHWWLNCARRHHLHHACYHGNYGFLFPFMDQLFATALPLDAMKLRAARNKKKEKV